MVGMGLMVGALWPVAAGHLRRPAGRRCPTPSPPSSAGADMSTPERLGERRDDVHGGARRGDRGRGHLRGRRRTAGEEETKTLGMLLGAPVARIGLPPRQVGRDGRARRCSSPSRSVPGCCSAARSATWGCAARNRRRQPARRRARPALRRRRRPRRGVAPATATAHHGRDGRARRGLSFAAASFLPLSDSLADGAEG